MNTETTERIAREIQANKARLVVVVAPVRDHARIIDDVSRHLDAGGVWRTSRASGAAGVSMLNGSQLRLVAYGHRGDGLRGLQPDVLVDLVGVPERELQPLSITHDVEVVRDVAP